MVDEIFERDVLEIVEPKLNLIKDGIQKEIRSLKTRLGKITGRIEGIENLDLQKQIFTHSDNVKSLNMTLLDSLRILSISIMDVTQYIVCVEIMKKYSGEKETSLMKQIQLNFARMSGDVKKSDSPLLNMIEFRQECIDFAKENHLNIFI